MIQYALDTNIISYILKKDEEIIKRYFQESKKGNEFIILPVVYYQVSRWLLERSAKKLLAEFDEMCIESPFVETNKEVWKKAAFLYVYTRKIGKPVNDDADLLIAAYCLLNNYVLVTNNTRHFEIIEGLKLANWKC